MFFQRWLSKLLFDNFKHSSPPKHAEELLHPKSTIMLSTRSSVSQQAILCQICVHICHYMVLGLLIPTKSKMWNTYGQLLFQDF